MIKGYYFHRDYFRWWKPWTLVYATADRDKTTHDEVGRYWTKGAAHRAARRRNRP